MPVISDNQGHILGWQGVAAVIIRHKGRTVTVDSGTITIVCEQCGEPMEVVLDTSDSRGLRLATTK